MTTLEALKQARILIADKERWCQGTVAAAADGTHLQNHDDGRACRWCALGALWRTVGPRESVPAETILNGAARARYRVTATLVNDDLGHAAVLQMFDDAIATATRDARR